MRFVGGALGAVVGGMIGGPVGAQLGFAVGSLIGGSFEPDQVTTQTGPRLDDLSQPTSNIVGNQIPIVYGTDRVPTGIIWSSNIKETKHVSEQSSGGKGGGGGQTVVTETFTYSASFAVGICEGPIAGIRRIWINRELLYNLDDPNISKVDFNFSVYYGTETQLPDPTIEAYEGVGNVNANRGLAYIVFEDLQLADFGNRIPVTIEVEVISVASIVTKATQSHLSITSTGGSPYWEGNQRIIKSPATGLLWKPTSQMDSRTDMRNGYFAEAFTETGNFVSGLSPNMDAQCGGRDPSAHSGFMHAIPNANGYLVFYCWVQTYISDGVYDRWLWIYEEDGTLVKNVTPRIAFQSGSFNFWNPRFMGYIGADYTGADLTNGDTWESLGSSLWITGSYDHSYIHDLTMAVAKDLDGSHYESYDARIDNGLYTYHTIDDPNYNTTYTQDFFSPENCQGWFGYEDDPYNLKKDMYVLKRYNTTYALLKITTRYSVGSLPAQYEFTTHKLLNYHGTDLHTGDSQRNFGGMTLENGDTWTMVGIRNDVAPITTPYYISVFVRPSGQTDFTYIAEKYMGEFVDDWMGYNVGFDPVRNELLLFEEGPDTLHTFNVITHEFAEQSITGMLDSVEHSSYGKPNRDIYVVNTNLYLIGNDNHPNVRMYRLHRDWTDKTSTTLGTIVGDICDRVNVSNTDYDTTAIDSVEVKGFSIKRHTNGKAILDSILPPHFVDPLESEWILKFVPFSNTTNVIDNAYLNAVLENSEENTNLYEITNEDIDEIPKALSLQYSGFQNNYLKTQQSAYRDGFIYNHDNGTIVQVPIVFNDNDAAQIADKLLYMLFISASKFKITLPIKYAYLEPTDVVTFLLDTESTQKTFSGKITHIETNALNLLEISGIRYYNQSIISYVDGVLEDTETDQIIPIVSYMYTQPIDFRPLHDYHTPETQGTSLYVTGAGYLLDWSGGQTYYSTDDVNYTEFLYISNAVTFGKLAESFSMYNRRYTVTDHVKHLEITVQGGPAPQSITDEQMKSGKNTMIIFKNTGEVMEVIQFQTVDSLSSNTYDISDIYRGRYQTYNNYKFSTYADANDRFIILNDNSLYQGSISTDLVDTSAYIKGVSVGQRVVDIPGTKYTYLGEWETNAPPVHFYVKWASSTTIDITWQAVSRFAGRVMFANPVTDQYVEKFRLEVYDVNDTLVDSVDDITGTSYTYTLGGGLVDGDYMEFRLYQYSDTHFYAHSNYATQVFTSDPETLIEGALQGTEQVHFEFKEGLGATTIIDNGAASNDFVQNVTPTSINRTKGRCYTNTIAGAHRFYGKQRFKSSISSGSSRNDVCFSFWITVHARPTSDVIIWDSDGGGLYGNYEIKLRTGGGLSFQIAGSVIDYTSTIPLNTPWFIMFSKNGNELRIYENGVLYSTLSASSFKWYLQGFMYLGPASNYSQSFTLADFRLFRDNIASDAKALEVYKYSRAKLLPQYRRF